MEFHLNNKAETMDGKYDQVKESFRNFCDGTSMHGFAELYHTKNLCWTVFWIVLLTSAIGLTTYQVIRAVKQFLDQSTNTRTEPSKENIYPPIKLCSMHWLYWIDWEKTVSMKFTKESVLYGMSYLTKIYTTNHFDVQLAKEHFHSIMTINNFTKMQQFYISVAKNVSLDSTFNQIHMYYSAIWNSTFVCHSISGETIKDEIINKNESEAIDINLLFGSRWFSWQSDYVSLDEYNWYMTDWFLTNGALYEDKNDGKVKNFSGYSLPLLLFADGYSQDYVPITEDVDAFSIAVSVQVNRWLPTPEYPCLADLKYIYSNISICDYCKASYADTVPKCNSIGTIDDSIENLCNNQIFIISLDTNSVKGLIPESEFHSQIKMGIQSNCTKCVFPCELWSYSSTFVTEKYSTETIRTYFTKTFTLVKIVYPRDIFITIEVERQTWEDFVANIGGLLGVWTGASLLSIIQLFYLCCFNRMNSVLIFFTKNRTATVIVTKEKAFKKENEECQKENSLN